MYHRDLSVLKPLLSLIYINDFADSIVLLKFLLFADDAQFFAGAYYSTVVNRLDAELCTVFKQNKLSLSIL